MWLGQGLSSGECCLRSLDWSLLVVFEREHYSAILTVGEQGSGPQEVTEQQKTPSSPLKASSI